APGVADTLDGDPRAGYRSPDDGGTATRSEVGRWKAALGAGDPPGAALAYRHLLRAVRRWGSGVLRAGGPGSLSSRRLVGPQRGSGVRLSGHPGRRGGGHYRAARPAPLRRGILSHSELATA